MFNKKQISKYMYDHYQNSHPEVSYYKTKIIYGLIRKPIKS